LKPTPFEKFDSIPMIPFSYVVFVVLAVIVTLALEWKIKIKAININNIRKEDGDK
jgi:hypothetical protein